MLFRAIGHLGDATVEHVAHHLPIIIRDFMRDALANATPSTITPAYISELFSKAIVAFDDAIAGDVLDLFGGIEGLKNFSDAQIRSIINDRHRGGANWQKVRLCMYGTTALVALVDPEHQNLWVANLGDCQAGMCPPSFIASDDVCSLSSPLFPLPTMRYPVRVRLRARVISYGDVQRR